MCGIFGIIGSEDSALTVRDFRRLTERLFSLSESRGKEASGLAVLPSCKADSIYVLKSPAPASTLMGQSAYKQIFENGCFADDQKMTGVAIGHTRLVTNGSQLDEKNNQPVIYDDAIGVHNGIIVNVDELWAQHPDLERHTDVDTEVLLALIRKYYRESRSPFRAVKRAITEIRGMASFAIVFSDLNIVLLATNHGSLHMASGSASKPLIFASEDYTLRRLLDSKLGYDFQGYRIDQVKPGHAIMLDLESFERKHIDMKDEGADFSFAQRSVNRTIESISAGKADGLQSVIEVKKASVPARFEARVNRAGEVAASLKRCTRCVLPSTVPFIDFDEAGVCNFCRYHKSVDLRGRDALDRQLAPYRRPGSELDCVCSISGGRDSCYGLHYVVKELGMKPLTYTYDWGMVTDIARRNISRICGQLGIEHILISADIPKKRRNIRMNVLAWLRKPHLGMIPLFMAGDKQFVWYGNRVKRQTGLELDFFTFNLFEKTQFKEEYTGIQMWRPGADADKLGEELGVWRGLKLCAFYGKEFLTNGAYLNRSIFDTFYGFVTYYVLPRTFVPLFRYVPWREEEVEDTLLNQYDFEVATDTKSTWRIGDGTASFYNYIYWMLGGFTEHDTFRSGQVREGHITREAAMQYVNRDNQPRWDSLKWYCDIIGIDFEKTVDRINEMDVAHPDLDMA